MSTEPFTLPLLTPWQKARMLRYAELVLTAQQNMTTAKGKNIIHHTLQKKRRHIQWNHYPKGDRIDHKTGAQYFYHCHRENYEVGEHGHFHCFLRYKQIPKRIKPMRLDDWDIFIDNPMTHLISIAMNRFGQPVRLFTVNRWVTSEVVYAAKHMPYFLNRFKMTLTDDPYWQILDRWVEGMVKLFAPQIVWLQRSRDALITRHQATNPEDNAYTNHELEELSQIPINLSEQIQWLMSNELSN